MILGGSPSSRQQMQTLQIDRHESICNRMKTREKNSCELHQAIDNWSDEGLNFIRMQFTASYTEWFDLMCYFTFCFCIVTGRDFYSLILFAIVFGFLIFELSYLEIGFCGHGRRLPIRTGSYSGIWINLLGGKMQRKFHAFTAVSYLFINYVWNVL